MNNNDLSLILKGPVPLIILETHDEPRALQLLNECAREKRCSAWKWTVTDGLGPVGFGVELKDAHEYAEPEKLFRYLKEQRGPLIIVLCDFHPFLDSPKNIRHLKDLALSAKSKGQKLILLSHSVEIPPELIRLSVRAELSVPGEEEILSIVREEAKAWMDTNRGKKIKTDHDTLHKLVANLGGLSHQDVRRLAHSAIANDGALTDEDLPELTRAKFELMNMEGVLHFEYSSAHLKDVAGFENLKTWLADRAAAMKAEAESSISLDAPKGVLLFGVQGGGKSLAAKAIAGVWGLPLLRLDMGSLFNKYIGETEKNLREALKLADLMSPCVLWVDEIEKGLAQESDNATSKRLLGTILTWMSERKSKVFLVATSNDISQLPPELMRKGRFDEIFFVDLPEEHVRQEIFKIHLRKRGHELSQFDLPALAQVSDGFTGAEIEQGVVSAMYSAAAQRVELEQSFVEAAIKQTQPLSVIMVERITELRLWASERAVRV